MRIKTIHIKEYVPILDNGNIAIEDMLQLKGLVKEIYDHALKNDHLFHFFFEPELIIRITVDGCLAKTKSFLQKGNITFEEYNYPFDPEGKFGEERGGVVANNLDFFLPVFHAHSVAALTMNEEDYFKYLERVIHTGFNPKLYSYEQEGKILAQLALKRLELIKES